jgi:hypothetical protein
VVCHGRSRSRQNRANGTIHLAAVGVAQESQFQAGYRNHVTLHPHLTGLAKRRTMGHEKPTPKDEVEHSAEISEHDLDQIAGGRAIPTAGISVKLDTEEIFSKTTQSFADIAKK